MSPSLSCQQPVHCRWGSYGAWSDCDGCTRTKVIQSTALFTLRRTLYRPEFIASHKANLIPTYIWLNKSYYWERHEQMFRKNEYHPSTVKVLRQVYWIALVLQHRAPVSECRKKCPFIRLCKLTSSFLLMNLDELDGLAECAKQNEQWNKEMFDWKHLILCLGKEDQVS